MKRIDIPFHPEMAEAVLSGRKTATSRTKRYGEPGDVFEIAGRGFVLKRIIKLRLRFVATCFHHSEGFASTGDFIAFWKRLHPRKGYNGDAYVWYHTFEEVDE